LEENFLKLSKDIFSIRPAGWKGDFLRKITLSSTTSPGIKTFIIK
jgi:ribosomal protein L1